MYLPQYEAKSVESEKISTVLNAVLQAKANTRNQIANELKISAMTVGKAVRMLIHAEVLVEQQDPATARGRRPFCLYPSDRLHSLIVYLTPTRATVQLCSADGRILEQCSISYCDSLPWEGNLACLRSTYEQCLARQKKFDTGVGIGVVLRDDCAFGEYAMNVLSQILRPDAVLWERELLTGELSKEEYGTSALYISCGENLVPMLIVGNTCIDGCPSKENTDSILDCIAGMLTVIPIAAVVVEEWDGYTIQKQELLKALADRLPEEQRACIRMIPDTARRLSSLAMERELRRRYAATFLK